MRAKPGRGIRVYFISIMATILCAGAGFAATLNVPSDYATIQQAIDAAVAGDTVLLADGTYTGTGNRDIDFRGKAITVKSANGAAGCILDIQAGTDNHRGFVFDEGEQTDSVIDGLTMTGGNHDKGSAVYITASSFPVLQNCVVTSNTKEAVYVDQSTCRLKSCRFENNPGTGVFGIEASIRVLSCVFMQNGWCIHVSYQTSYLRIRDSQFISNDSGIDNSGELEVTNCLFERNRGSAIRNRNSDKPFHIYNSRFCGNSDSWYAGAIEEVSGNPCRIVNCVFSGNFTHGDTRPGAIYGTAEITNCTFYGNGKLTQRLNPVASVQGGGFVRNCVFWNEVQSVLGWSPSYKMAADYCILESLASVTGSDNRILNPRFIDPDGEDGIPGTADDNLRVYLDSPCTDGGNNNYQPTDYPDVDSDGNWGELVPLDLDGDPRRVMDPRMPEGTYPIIDIGAYENPKRAVCVSPRFVRIPEGTSGSFTVFLGRAPQQAIEVLVTPERSDRDLWIESGQTLTFTPDNYLIPQTVVVHADEDDDRNQGAGYFVVSAEGYYPDRVVVKEQEDGPGPTNWLYVDADSTGANNGMSWEDAFRSLQDALEFCRRDPNLFNEVHIAQGTYCPAEPNGDLLASFRLVANVALRGGYAGFGEPNSDARDIDKYVTILSGDLNHNDGPTISVQGDTDNSYQIVMADRFVVNTLLEGLTITGARQHTNDLGISGRAVYNEGCIQIQRCKLIRNHISALLSTNQIEMIECGFFDNLGIAASIYNGYGRQSLMSRCVFAGNLGFIGDLRNGTVRHCVFVNNVTNYPGYSPSGFGVDSTTKILHCIFWGNGDGSRQQQIKWEQWGNSPPAISYSCVQGWANDLPATGVFSANPFFVDGYNPDPEKRDFHLTIDSSCIDAGDPAADYSQEPQPNGGRIDIGLYGNTPEATVTLDSDNNGYLNPIESRWGLDPQSDDGDHDELTDAFEIGYDGDAAHYDPYNPITKTGKDLNAASSDTDADGLSDWRELYETHTDPLNPDMDGDGVLDGDEVDRYGTNPKNPDSDGDGMQDGWEIQYGLDPLVDDRGGDLDGDGVDNYTEFLLGTKPNNTDSDGDTMPDGWEVAHGLNAAIDDRNLDLDGDGYTNFAEYQRHSLPNDAESVPQGCDLYVDDDAPNDPGPYDTTVSDPLANGSAEHPFDGIPKAINAAQNGMIIGVADGLYIPPNGINFNGKAVVLRSLNGPAHCTILLKSTGVQFVSGEKGTTVLEGFTITGCSYDAISINKSSPQILRCIIARNGGYGVAVNNGAPLIQGCTLLDNWDGINGIAMTGVIRDCEIRNSQYCGISLNSQSNVLIENCLIAENGTLKNTNWPGVFASGSTAILKHSTIAMQIYQAGSPTGIGDGIKLSGGAVQVENSIVWGCTRSIYLQSGAVTVGYSDIQGGYAGTGNLDADPQFVRMGRYDASETPNSWVPGDYHLTQGSPCINAGLNGTTGAAGEDIDGQPRIAYGRTDMGADEFMLTDFDGDGATNLSDFSVFAGQWLRGGCGVCDWTDYSGDETVGIEDLMIFLGQWLAEPAEEFQPVPILWWRLDGNYRDYIAQIVAKPSGNPIFSGDHPKGIGTQSLTLDGNDSLLLSDYSFGGYKPRATMAWIRTTQTESVIINAGFPNPGWLWRLGIVEGKLNLDVGGGGYVRGSTPVNTGQWVHVSAELLAGGTTTDHIRLYVNGIREAVTRSSTLNIDTYTFAGTSAGNGMIGQIDDIRFYDCALSQKAMTEVAYWSGVDAGADQVVNLNLGNQATLKGQISPGWSGVSVVWEQVSGPAAAVIGTPTELSTMVEFSLKGGYAFRLTGTDGIVTASDEVVISVTQGLVGYWKFDGNLADEYGHSGTAEGDPAFVGAEQAKVGSGAVDLDGNDAVVVNGFAGITGTQARTTMAWIKTTGTLGPIVYWGDKNTTGGMWDMRVNSLGQLRAQMNGCGINGVSAVNTGQWVHVATVLPEGASSPADVQLYVNGVRETGALTAGTINTKAGASMRIGANETGNFFTGLIDDVRVYDRALTAEEIGTIAGM